VRHEHFEWNEAKAAANYAKHGVRFDAAVRVLRDIFADRFHVEEFDSAHSTEREDRWITTGSQPDRRHVVLVISWTQRVDSLDRKLTRIISARRATKGERKDYEQETGQT
jgi:uncharacterized DUF497 family protein